MIKIKKIIAQLFLMSFLSIALLAMDEPPEAILLVPDDALVLIFSSLEPLDLSSFSVACSSVNAHLLRLWPLLFIKKFPATYGLITDKNNFESLRKTLLALRKRQLFSESLLSLESWPRCQIEQLLSMPHALPMLISHLELMLLEHMADLKLKDSKGMGSFIVTYHNIIIALPRCVAEDPIREVAKEAAHEAYPKLTKELAWDKVWRDVWYSHCGSAYETIISEASTVLWYVTKKAGLAHLVAEVQDIRISAMESVNEVALAVARHARAELELKDHRTIKNQLSKLLPLFVSAFIAQSDFIISNFKSMYLAANQSLEKEGIFALSLRDIEDLINKEIKEQERDPNCCLKRSLNNFPLQSLKNLMRDIYQ